MNRLAVYCGSASPADERYVALARIVGSALASRGIGVVYGGGRLGLMGALAAGALDAGGEVIGVIPRALVDAEVANPDCTELRVVATMHERKQAFTDMSDGFLTLPGGVGTMDELWEMMTLLQTGKLAKNNLILIYGKKYWDEVLNWKAMVRWGMINEDEHKLLKFADNVDEAFDLVRADMEKYHMEVDPFLQAY